jgi:hypothetical protein
MRKLYLPLRWIHLFAFYQGISTELRAPHAPHQSFGDCIFLSSTSISRSLASPLFLPPSSPYPVLSAHGGKKLDPPYGCVDPFLSDGEEPRRAGGRRSLTTEDEPGLAGVEGAADQPPGVVASRGLRGELCRFPRKGAQGAAEQVHAGDLALLWGGASSSRP